MTAPRQPDLFAAEVSRVHAEVNDQARLMGKKFEVDPVKIDAFTFTGEGCVPDPNYVAPDFLRLPSDSPDWMPAPAVGRRWK
jgi:hypothetical protein